MWSSGIGWGAVPSKCPEQKERTTTMVSDVLQADMRDIQAVCDLLSTLSNSCHVMLTTSPHGYEVSATLVAVISATDQLLELSRNNEQALINNAGELLGILGLVGDDFPGDPEDEED